MICLLWPKGWMSCSGLLCSLFGVPEHAPEVPLLAENSKRRLQPAKALVRHDFYVLKNWNYIAAAVGPWSPSEHGC